MLDHTLRVAEQRDRLKGEMDMLADATSRRHEAELKKEHALAQIRRARPFLLETLLEERE